MKTPELPPNNEVQFTANATSHITTRLWGRRDDDNLSLLSFLSFLAQRGTIIRGKYCIYLGCIDDRKVVLVQQVTKNLLLLYIILILGLDFLYFGGWYI